MVWLLLGIVILSCLLFLVGPLLRPADEQTIDTVEVYTYQTEITRLETEFKVTKDPKVEARKIDLQRQLLALTRSNSPKASLPLNLIINGLFVFFIFGGLGIYSILGRPDLTQEGAIQKPTLAAPQALSQNIDPEHANNASLEGLVSQLKEKLDGARKDDPDGWMLYARSLMNLKRFDEAFEAYENVLTLTNNSSEVEAEYQRAQDFAATRAQHPAPTAPRGPTLADVEAASQMDDSDRQAMIEGMVANLAARLETNPQDPEGWARLLRARSVLGQVEQMSVDIDRVNEIYADNPELRNQIIGQSLPKQ